MSRLRFLLLGLLLALATLSSACVEPSSENRIRANALFRGGDFVGAVAECDKGLGHEPSNVGLLILKGKSLFELGRFADAKAAYDQALAAGKGKRDVFLGDAYSGLAVIAARTNDWPSARDRYLDLLQLNPEDASTHLNLARLYGFVLNEPLQAVDHAEKAARLRGEDEDVLFTLGKLYLAMGRRPEAEKTFQRICDVVPEASSCPYGVALVAARAGDKARALSKLREAVGRKVPNPENIPNEPAFGSWRNDPEFVAIVESAKK